jgi:hypothetical protein
MDDAEIDRLRKMIRRSYANSPHKRKLWLALLEMHGGKEKKKDLGARNEVAGAVAGRPPVECRRR